MAASLLSDIGTPPEVDTELEALTDLGEQLIYEILESHPLSSIKALIDAGAPVWYQNEAEGISPLHAAAYDENVDLMKMLLEEGAVWNAVDYYHNTAGDIALSMNNEICYNVIRDAGIRAELLLALLSGHENPEPNTLLVRSEDTTAAGSPAAFLSSRLTYSFDACGQEICSVQADGEEIGVMMGWEKGIMHETARKLCEDHVNVRKGLKILNIGFGLGIIDQAFQSLVTPPSQHVIIEAHPDVLNHMCQCGWSNKPGVKILEGRWQDFIASEELRDFDIVYTDTFSEDYAALQEFFGHLPRLLADDGSRFSFFNGLGATNNLFYDVYTHVAEVHLAGIGIDLQWSDVMVEVGKEAERWGGSREYFKCPVYRLPIGKLKQRPS